MNHATALTSPTEGDEDDWETADIAPPKPAKTLTPSLRPSAPEFKPRPLPPASADSAGPKSATTPRTAPSRDAGQGGDEWFASRRPASNRQIWDSANATPPPTLLAPTATSHLTSSPIPPTPAMQILRRPADSNSGRRGMSDEARRAKTLVEREEEYRLARERIFGAEGAASTSVEAGGDRGGGRSEEGRSGGPGEGGTGSGSGSGRGSGRSSPIVLDSLGVVPSQVRRSEQPGSGSGLGKGKESGVVRQPRGPGEGGGFRR